MPNCKCCGKPVTGGVVLHRECYELCVKDAARYGVTRGTGNPSPTVAAHDEFEMILVCAVRYACGRQTYMPSVVIHYITPLIPYLGENTLHVIDKDLQDAEQVNMLGDPLIDAPKWREFHECIKKERRRRVNGG